MRAKTTIRVQALGLVLVAGVATVAWTQAMRTLRYKGEVVSRSVRIIDGRPWIPLSDAARLVGGSAVKVGSGYEIRAGDVDTTTPVAGGDSNTPAGGTGEVPGQRGTIGQMLFTGKWRFEVTGVDYADSYDTKHEPTSATVKPAGDNEHLAIVNCIVKNGVSKPRQLILRLQNIGNTALADDQGQSYPPIRFDFAGGSGYGPNMLPGSQQNFAIVFSIPKGTNLKDLVFTLASIEDNNGTDVRISLAR